MIKIDLDYFRDSFLGYEKLTRVYKGKKSMGSFGIFMFSSIIIFHATIPN